MIQIDFGQTCKGNGNFDLGQVEFLQIGAGRRGSKVVAEAVMNDRAFLRLASLVALLLSLNGRHTRILSMLGLSFSFLLKSALTAKLLGGGSTLFVDSVVI